jgi:hypothetical protein
VGKYWVMPGVAPTLCRLDVSDPAAPREVSRLDTPEDFNPHCPAKDPFPTGSSSGRNWAASKA